MKPRNRHSRFRGRVPAAIALATLAACVAALGVFGAGPSGNVLAAEPQPWPQHPITIVQGFSPGSGVDVVARFIQEPLTNELGQPVIFDYKSGAAGNLASEFVANAKPNGYTLDLGTAATHGSNAALYRNMHFDVEKDFEPVATLVTVSNVLTINPHVIDVKDLKGFVDNVKANPGKYNYASTGNGTGTHMAFAEFNHSVGLDMVHVPYKGGPDALLAVLRGEACCLMNQVQTVLPHYREHKVRLLGVTTRNRVAVIPDVPTIAESGIAGTHGFDSAIWFGLFAPKGTDPTIIGRLNDAVRTVLQQASVKSRIEELGNSVRIETPDQFRQTVANDRRKWAKVVRDSAVSID